MNVCPNENDPVFKKLVKELGGRTQAMRVFRENGNILPEMEDVDAFIAYAKTQEAQANTLSEKDKLEKILEKLHHQKVELDSSGFLFKRKDNDKIVSKRIEDLVRDFYRSIYNPYGSRSYSGNFYAKKAAVVDKYMKFIIDTLEKGGQPNLNSIKTSVLQLKNLDIFSEEEDSFFSLNQPQFDTLVTAASELLDSIKEIQKEIDSEGEVKIFTDIAIYDEVEDRAGTVSILAVFSDGSSSIYDTQIFSSRGATGPYDAELQSWEISLANKRAILRDHYGITKFRHQRVIPFNVSFSKKNSTGEFINNYKKGFQAISTYTKQNQLAYLKAIPFGERTKDRNLNRLLDSLEKEIDKLEEAIRAEQSRFKKRDLYRRRTQLFEVLKRVERDANIGFILDYAKGKVASIKKELSSDNLSESELLVLINELEVFRSIYSDLITEVRSEKDEEKRKELLTDLNETNNLIADGLSDVRAELLDRVFALRGDIFEAGEIEGFYSKYLDGITNKNSPVFQQLSDMYSTAKRIAFNKTQKQIKELLKVDKAFREWASANGISQEAKFKIIVDENLDLKAPYTEEFFSKFKAIKKSLAEGNSLSVEDLKFLKDSTEFDMERYLKEVYEPLSKSFEKDFREGLLTEDEYLDKITELEDTSPQKNEKNKYILRNFKFLEPRKDLKNYYSKDWEYIISNRPVYDYYMHLQNLNIEYGKTFGKDLISKYFTPNTQQTLVQRFTQGGGKALSLGNITESLKRVFGTQEVDEIGGRTVDGRRVKVVPLYFTNDIQEEPTSDRIREIEEEVSKKYKRGSEEYKDEVNKALTKERLRLGLATKSSDLTSSYILFINNYNEYVELTTIEPMLKSIRYLMESRGSESSPFKERLADKKGLSKFIPFTKDIIEDEISPETIKVWDELVDRLFYKRQFNAELFASWAQAGFSSNRIIKGLMKYLSIRVMGLDLILGAAQAAQGITNIIVVGAEGRYFNKKQVFDSIKDFQKHKKSFQHVVEFFNPTARDIVSEQSELNRANFFTRRFTSRSFFLSQIKPTEMTENIIAVSMSKNYVVDSDGKIKNKQSKSVKIINPNAPTVQDSIVESKDGELKIPGVTEKELVRFRNKIMEQSRIVMGSMTQEQMGSIHNNIIFHMFTQFRQWIQPLYEARFRGLRYNPTMEEIEVGRMNVLLSALFTNGFLPAVTQFKRIFLDGVLLGRYSYQKNKQYYETRFQRWLDQNPQYLNKYGRETLEAMFEDTVDAKVRGAVSELRVYLGLLLIVSLARGLDWDDEEESNFFTWNTHRILERSFLEASFWLNPKSVNETVRAPLPLTTVFSDTGKIIRSINREIAFSIEGERDARVKDPGYYTLKMIPLANQVGDLFGYFEQYNSPTSGTEYILDALLKSE